MRVWNGQRILPAGWLEYTRTPAPGDERGLYGAHFWLGLPPAKESAAASFELPDDLFHARGYEGQYLVIIPSLKIVIVRLGLTREMDDWDPRGLISGVVDALASRS